MLLHYDHFNARILFILHFLFHYVVQPKVVSIHELLSVKTLLCEANN